MGEGGEGGLAQDALRTEGPGHRAAHGWDLNQSWIQEPLHKCCKDSHTPEMQGLRKENPPHTRILGEPSDTMIQTLATP